MVNNKIIGFEDSEYLFIELNMEKACAKRYLKKNLRTLLKICNQLNRMFNQENLEPRI